MSRRRIIVMAGVAAVTVTGAVVGFASLGQAGASSDAPEQNGPAQVVGHQSDDDPAAVEKYWTPERMKKAEQFDPMPEPPQSPRE